MTPKEYVMKECPGAFLLNLPTITGDASSWWNVFLYSRESGIFVSIGFGQSTVAAWRNAGANVRSERAHADAERRGKEDYDRGMGRNDHPYTDIKSYHRASALIHAWQAGWDKEHARRKRIRDEVGESQ